MSVTAEDLDQIAGEEQVTTDDNAGNEEQQQKEAAEQQAAEEKEKHTVPLAKFLETRNELKETRERLQRIEQTLVPQLEELRKGKAEPEPQEPDFMQDPKKYIDHSRDSVVGQLKSLGEKLDKTAQQTEQLEQMRVLQDQMTRAEETFVEKTPDYYEALNFMRERRFGQLQTIYPDATEQQIRHAIGQEEFNTMAQLLQKGRDPAEAAYKFAQGYGYQPKQKDIPETDDKLQERKQAAQSLGSSTGNADQLTGLLSATEDEFDSAMKELFGRPARSR